MKAVVAARALCLAGTLAIGPLSAPCRAQGAATRIQPGFNLFTVQQDIDLGRSSAAQAEAQLTLLNEPSADAYLNRIIQKLAAVAPGAQYPYTIKIVNAAEINAFALPGGPMYVNRGLIAEAGSEAELVGVLAHEMSHVALRHGTHQASTAYLAQTGLGILGGLLGKNGSRAADVVNAVGGLGLNAAFLKFSRTYEYEADETGAEIMARAGYNPTAMADFFEKLRALAGRDPSKLEQFFSDHPPPADREARIRQLAQSFPRAPGQDIGGLAAVQTSLGGLPAAPVQTAQQTLPPPAQPGPALPGAVNAAAVAARMAAPSARLARFQQPAGFFTVNVPDNWRAYPASSGLAVSFAPEGGIVDLPNGQQAILEGVIVNHYAPFQQGGRGTTLKTATDDLVGTVLRSNTYLRTQGAAKARTGGTRGFTVRLAGTSPVSGQVEHVTVVTQGLPDGHVMYALGIAPARESVAFDRAFSRMLQSLRVNDQAAHRGN
jgi:Zn-dependent protease with chaperone function